MKCIACGTEIPAGRLKVLPFTKTCVKHSETLKYIGNVVSHGDVEAGELFQEFDIIRTEQDRRSLESYRSKLGSYK